MNKEEKQTMFTRAFLELALDFNQIAMKRVKGTKLNAGVTVEHCLDQGLAAFGKFDRDFLLEALVGHVLREIVSCAEEVVSKSTLAAKATGREPKEIQVEAFEQVIERIKAELAKDKPSMEGLIE